jgi:L-2,4-diaminobutyric acid acetyltransferase
VIAHGGAASSAPAGFTSGYLIPDRPTTLFIWQVAVAEAGRGHGLAKQMLFELLDRPACQGVTHIETTITPSNGASWALFRSLARSLGCPLVDRVLFDRDAQFNGVHESEVLAAIGPFDARGDATAKKTRRTK